MIINKELFKEELVKDESVQGYQWVNNCLINNSFLDSDSNDIIWHGSQFSARSLTPYTTTWTEQIITEEKLDHYFKTNEIDQNAVVIDLGSGDGRITNYLIQRGFKNVIAVDYEKESVFRIKSNNPEASLLALADDVKHLPFKEGIADVILAWALFTSTPNFIETMDAALKLLKPGGLLINAEPTLEHALTYALIRQDIEEFTTIGSTSTRARMWDQKELRYSIHPIKELNRMMKHASLKSLHCDGISIFPSLIFGGVTQDKPISESEKEKLWVLLKQLSDNDIQDYRQLIYVSKKI